MTPDDTAIPEAREIPAEILTKFTQIKMMALARWGLIKQMINFDIILIQSPVYKISEQEYYQKELNLKKAVFNNNSSELDQYLFYIYDWWKS